MTAHSADHPSTKHFSQSPMNRPESPWPLRHGRCDNGSVPERTACETLVSIRVVTPVEAPRSNHQEPLTQRGPAPSLRGAGPLWVRGCRRYFGSWNNMDNHTLEILEFDKVRALVAARAACSLGRVAAGMIEPTADPGEIHHRQSLTTEMVEALLAGVRPSFGGLHDIRLLVRRAQVGGMLESEELAETVETLRAIGDLDRWLARIGDQFPRLGGLRQSVGEFSGVVVAIEGCLDNRGKVLDTASRRLSALRREIVQVEERIQETLRHLLRSPDVRRILRFPNFTMVGHHYVLPVSKDHRGEVQGSVLRTSASNETVYIEPTAIGERSAQLSFLRRARPRRSGGSCDGSVPRSGWSRRACSARWRPWPSST